MSDTITVFLAVEVQTDDVDKAETIAKETLGMGIAESEGLSWYDEAPIVSHSIKDEED
jgi:hypothetical protein